MTDPESPDRLLPYMNPLYWDGHAIGHCQHPTAEWRPRPAFGRQSKQSRINLSDRLEQTGNMEPIETYRAGETFDAAAYAVGTLVVLRLEQLHGLPEDLKIDPEDLKDQLLPQRPLDITPHFGSVGGSNTDTFIGDGHFHYQTTAEWGIVTETKKGDEELRNAGMRDVFKRRDGTVMVLGVNMDIRKTPIKIGETEHSRQDKGRERLRRVNALDVIAYGQTARQKSATPATARRAAQLAFGA